MITEKKKITISAVLECLDNGMSREEIAEHFGISKTEVKKMFKHPSLKGKKAKKQVSFELVDDISNPITNEVVEQEIASNEENEDVIAEEMTEQEIENVEFEN